MMKTIKVSLFTALAAAALCAGTVSARQLRGPAATSPFCGGICSKKASCSIDCFCNIPAGERSGSCILPPAVKPAK